MKRAAAIFLVGLLSCTGSATMQGTEPAPGPDGEPGPGQTGGDGKIPSTGDLSNQDVYTRLGVTCAGCHTLSDRPYFGSLQSFENLLVYDRKYVVPGDPAASLLLKMLNGTGTPQMPPAPLDHFAALESKGQTKITMAELAQWISQLPAPTVMQPLDVSVVRRKSAEQVVRSLYDQLGLSESDFYDADMYPKAGDSYAVRSPDAIPYADPFEQGGTLFSAMGGPWWLEGKWRNDAPTGGFVRALTHVSQAWCRTAFNKPGNTAVLSKATLSDGSSSPAGEAAIRANISDLYLRMLGEVPLPEEVDDLYLNVFVPYESKGSVTAWTAVCASLVRDPLWMVY